MISQTNVYIYLHTHWDREWYRTFQQYRLKLVEVIDKILGQLDRNEIEYFTLDGQAIILEDYLEVRPENKERLVSYIKSGKIFVGPWYVLPDEFLVSGESLIQNLYLGHKLSEKYGCVSKIGYLPDTFGHSIDIPMILSKFGIDNAILWRGINLPKSEFIWYSLNRSHIKALSLVEGYYSDIFQNDKLDIKEKSKLLSELLTKIKASTTIDSLLLPVGGDHLPPPDKLKEQIKDLNKYLPEYNFIESNLKVFLDHIIPDELDIHVQQELRDPSKSYILPGVYSSRLYLKQLNAMTTNKIVNFIEPLTAYINLLSLDEFELPCSEYLWKQLLLNHPHDSICGCSIDEVHEENEARFKQLDQACNELINRSKFALIKTLPKNKVGVFNASGSPFSGVVELVTYHDLQDDLISQKVDEFEDRYFTFYADIKEHLPATIIKKQTSNLLWVDNADPYSLKILGKSDIKNTVSVKDGLLTNDLIEIVVNSDSITVKDLQYNTEYTGLNQIIDCLDSGDSYNFAPVSAVESIKASIVNSKILEAGPLRGIISIKYEIDLHEGLNIDRNNHNGKKIKHTIICEVIIKANSKMVEFNLTWENKSKDHLLQVVLPTNNDIYSTLVENHFSVLERRFDPYYNITDYMPVEKGVELKTNTAPMQRFVQANNIALIVDGLPEYGVFKDCLYLTILRSTGYLSRPDVLTRGAEAGPSLKVKDNQCMRACKARYAFHPKTTVNDLYTLASHFMGCCTAVFGENEVDHDIDLEKSLIQWDNPNIISTRCLQNNIDSSIVLHLLNISSYPQSIVLESAFKIDHIVEVDFLLSTIEKIIDNKIILKSNEIKAIKFILS